MIKTLEKKFILLLFILCYSAHAQKVGLVLSGGGASGLAHIGVIKSLEENNVPIDYITGTSMGALIGCLYAIGYSPQQMEKFVKSDEFKSWAYGNIEDKYVYYFKKKEDNASWIVFKLALDSSLETTLPTNLISPVPIDFAIMEKTAGAIAAANYNFDSLFVPFRCLAADIDKKKPVVLKQGDLGEAVRASLSYPFYLKPIMIDGKLLFDGGIYNNFPSDVMLNDFYPDIIIGSNVTNNAPPPQEDNLISQLKTMLLNKTNYKIECENGIIIEPSADVGLFDFSSPQSLIDSGYVAAQRKMSQIKEFIPRTITPEELNKKRALFLKKERPIEFKNIYIEGLNKQQSNYARKLLIPKQEIVPIEQLKSRYFRLAEDDKIKDIFPKARYNNQSGYYDLNLNIKKEKNLFLQVGGDFSNRPISEGFIGAQYNHLGNSAISIMGNTYFGKLYNSAQLAMRFDFPFKLLFYVEPSFTLNRMDFFNSSDAPLILDTKPPYLIQEDQHGEIIIGVPTGKKSKITVSAGFADLTDQYYQTTKFSEKDTADKTTFNSFTSCLSYEVNSLNRKQYASEGIYTAIKLRYVNGEEYDQPGSTSLVRTPFQKDHQWFQLKAVHDDYFFTSRIYKAGVYFEGVLSDQDFFNNYTASVLNAPAFQPIPEGKTLFQESYRAYNYVAGGLKNIISFGKNIDLRLEGYLFQPYQQIVQLPDLSAGYTPPFSQRYIIATAALVGHTPLGPISFSVNYYDHEQTKYTFLFHFGYILFNKSAFD